MDLLLPRFFRSQRGLPVVQIGDRSARITDGAEADLLIQRLELIFDLHGLRIEGAVTIERIPVVDTEDGSAVDRSFHIVRLYGEHDRNKRLICVYRILQRGSGCSQLAQRKIFLCQRCFTIFDRLQQCLGIWRRRAQRAGII